MRAGSAAASRSTRLRPRQATSRPIGCSAPTSTSVVDSDVTEASAATVNAPMPIAARIRLSSTPNTRASSRSSAARCNRVNVTTSISTRPVPVTITIA